MKHLWIVITFSQVLKYNFKALVLRYILDSLLDYIYVPEAVSSYF